jgi:hypothetical protein
MTAALVVEPDPRNCSQSAYRTMPLSGEAASEVPALLEPASCAIEAVHTPLTHVWVDGHANPHALQLFGSVCSFTQVPLHITNPEAHAVMVASYPAAASVGGAAASTDEAQIPSVQDVPAEHANPQAPQLFESVSSSTQVPLHVLNPDAHVVMVASYADAASCDDPVSSTGSAQMP